MDPRQMTDKELYKRCQEAGQNARKWLKVFAGLLPEVQRRELYKKHGFHSIFEFAAKLAGLRHETVVEILRVYYKLEDKPELKRLFEEGRQGWTKIKAAASVATSKTDGLWAKRVSDLSKSAIEELAKEERTKSIGQNNQQVDRPGAGLFDFGSEDKDSEIKSKKRRTINIQLNPDVYAQLVDLKAKIEKKKKEPIDYNEVIKKLLNSFDFEKENLIPYQEVIHRCHECQKNTLKSSCGDIELDEKDLKNREKIGETVILEEEKEIIKRPSRYIPAKVKKIIELEHGKGCSYPGCKKPAKVLHHTKRFALDPKPDPDVLKPLCDVHHELCHGSAVRFEDEDPGRWQLSLMPDGTGEKQAVDRRVQVLRMIGSKR